MPLLLSWFFFVMSYANVPVHGRLFEDRDFRYFPEAVEEWTHNKRKLYSTQCECLLSLGKYLSINLHQAHVNLDPAHETVVYYSRATTLMTPLNGNHLAKAFWSNGDGENFTNERHIVETPVDSELYRFYNLLLSPGNSILQLNQQLLWNKIVICRSKMKLESTQKRRRPRPCTWRWTQEGCSCPLSRSALVSSRVYLNR